jgi:hypothetical protein
MRSPLPSNQAEGGWEKPGIHCEYPGDTGCPCVRVRVRVRVRVSLPRARKAPPGRHRSDARLMAAAVYRLRRTLSRRCRRRAPGCD